jgi:hypothetical protein
MSTPHQKPIKCQDSKRTNGSIEYAQKSKFGGRIWSGGRMAKGDEGIWGGSGIWTATTRAKGGGRLWSRGKMWSRDETYAGVGGGQQRQEKVKCRQASMRTSET